MTDDDRRLAQRLRAYESRVPDAPEPSTSFSRGRMPWGIAAIAAAALLAAVLIGGNLLNQRNVGNVDPSASPSSPATATASTEGTVGPSASPEASTTASPSTEGPTPVVTPPQAAISGVDWDDAVTGQIEGYVLRIGAEGGRFYALGSTGDGASVWSSSDGTSWQRSDLPRPAEWGTDIGDLHASHIASIGDRLVVIGAVGINDYFEVVVWESTDGSTWQEIDTGDFRVDGFIVADLSLGPGGLVAITNNYAPGTGSAWRSGDGGHSWTEHRPPGERVTVNAVVGTTRGYLIGGGVGATTYDTTTPAPRIWYSPDGMGTSWQPADLEGSGGSGHIEELAIDGSGRWVAIGVLNERIAVWRSIDRGLTWQVTANLGPVDASTRANFRLVGVPDGFVAVSGGDSPVTWTSTDGVTWLAGAALRPGGVSADLGIDWKRGIARIGDVILLAGESFGPEGQQQNEWFAWKGTIQR